MVSKMGFFIFAKRNKLNIFCFTKAWSTGQINISLKPIGSGTHHGRYWYSGDQKQGDCRIKISSAYAKVDDGLWECLITGFDSHDYHYSEPVRLIVRGKNLLLCHHSIVIFQM